MDREVWNAWTNVVLYPMYCANFFPFYKFSYRVIELTGDVDVTESMKYVTKASIIITTVT